jgi:hypothetical protein
VSGRSDPLDPVEAVDPLTVTPAEVVDLIAEAAERLDDINLARPARLRVTVTSERSA